MCLLLCNVQIRGTERGADALADHESIISFISIHKNGFWSEDLMEAFRQPQVVLTRVAHHSQPIQEVQMVCDHPGHQINLQWQLKYLQIPQFLPT